MKIKTSIFEGIAPKISARLLKNSQAQIADNCRFSSGSLKSWGAPLFIENLNNVGEIFTIYKYTGSNPNRWLAWNVDVDVVEGQISDDITSRIYWTGDGNPKAADNANNIETGIEVSLGNNIYPENSVNLGVPEPTIKPTVSVNTVGTNTEDRVYVYTLVNKWGEESAPSPVSDIVTCGAQDGSIDLSDMETSTQNGYRSIDKIRIYRSLSGSTATKLHFVSEIEPLSTHTDSVKDTELQEIISTENYDLPPSDMFGLIDLGNGIMAGFTEYEICFCEPYLPYAWPIKYRLAVSSTIVGAGRFGNNLVVCTDSEPVLVTGNHPATMTMATHSSIQACISKKGIVSNKNGVIYPSPNGLYYLGYGGGRLLTDGYYENEGWLKLSPTAFRAALWDDRYICFNETEGYVFEMDANASIRSISRLTFKADAIYVDKRTGDLYTVNLSGIDNKLEKFNGSPNGLTYIWKSKIFPMNKKISITSGRITYSSDSFLSSDDISDINSLIATIVAENQLIIDSGSTGGEINKNKINTIKVAGSRLKSVPQEPINSIVKLRIFGDRKLIVEKAVFGLEPFKFPSIKKYREYEIEIESITEIDDITLASSVRDLT